MSRYPVDAPATSMSFRPVVAIALPARNEAAGIESCMRALDSAAAHAASAQVHLLVLVNNSQDETAAIAGAFSPTSLQVSVVEIVLRPDHAHAGGARLQACNRAIALLPADGVLLTTDADSHVAPDWISANLAELAAGADAVAGVVAFDEATREALPPLPVRALEWQLAGLHARLGCLIDPRAHDPWPNHIWAWGASLAMTASAYRRIGGIPSVPLAEDRALAESIERFDLKLRHSHAAVVWTSARQSGRAPGGLADLVQSYVSDPATPCDAALEPMANFVRRLCWRARLRRIAARDGLAAAARAARRLGHSGPHPSGFGALWTAVESQSPSLRRARVVPAMLATEVTLCARLISRIERRGVSRADIAVSALAA